MDDCDSIKDDCDEQLDHEEVFHESQIKPNLEIPRGFRKIRTNSYHRAIKTSPTIVIKSLPSVAERNEDEVTSQSNQLLYQEVKERGILNESVDDEEIDFLNVPAIKRQGTLRQSWIYQSEVQESGILQTMSSRERKRQEAMFELITSESSYYRSLNILVNYFMASKELCACIPSTEYHHLFSNIKAVRSTCSRFFKTLQKRRHSSSIVINDVCDIVIDFVTSGAFDPYITYCSNEIYQQRALQRLMAGNSAFMQVLRTLESSKECAGLPLHSFLLLPMQRITRLPLLVDTIRQRCDVTMPQRDVASRALKETTRLVKVCNERAKSLERTEQMIQLQQQLEFKSSRSFALVSSSRYLLKRGSIVRSSEEFVLGFRRISKQEVYLFMFNDVLLLAKKKSNDAYSVTDFCYKNRLHVRDIINDTFSFIVVMTKNQEGHEVEMRFETDTPNAKARWMMAMKSPQKHKQETTSATMQVEIIRSLITDEPDMTSLKIMDVYIVVIATPDGWIYGERTSDGCRAWFPSTHVKEILSEKVRERNLQRRCRLLGEQTLI